MRKAKNPTRAAANAVPTTPAVEASAVPVQSQDAARAELHHGEQVLTVAQAQRLREEVTQVEQLHQEASAASEAIRAAGDAAAQTGAQATAHAATLTALHQGETVLNQAQAQEYRRQLPEHPNASNQAPTDQAETPESQEPADDFMHALDADGNPVPDAELATWGQKPRTLEFKAGGLSLRAEVVFLQVSPELRAAALNAAQVVAARPEFQGRPPGDTEAEFQKAVAARFVAMEQAFQESPEVQCARAAMTIAALHRDEEERPRVSIGHFRRADLTPEMLLADKVLGWPLVERVFFEVQRFFE